jgi:putative tryptophan/tyrosine transport system substrate-binding protein
MKRREFIAGFAGAVAWPLAARGQQPARIRRVGVLMDGTVTEPERQSWLAAFVQGLRQLGWTEGQNIRMDVRWNAADAGLARTYAEQLIGLMPDVILAASTVNLTAIRQATSTVPVVFVVVADPVGQGFVGSVPHPGGNLTGFSYFEFSLGGKWLGLLKEVAPGFGRVAVTFNPDMGPQYKFFMPVIEAAAQSFGVEAIATPVRSTADIEPALASFVREPNGGLMLPGDSFTIVHQKLIANLTGRFRLPSISGIPDFAKDGGLMDYGPQIDLLGQYRQAASYVDRILNGLKPDSLPIQGPDKYRLVFNLSTAKTLGLIVPPTLLAIADEVIGQDGGSSLRASGARWLGRWRQRRSRATGYNALA